MQYGVTEPSACGEIVCDLIEARRRHQPQGLKNVPELPVLRERLGAIAFHDERADEHAPAALAQRVRADRSRRTRDCRRHVARRQMGLAEGLEGAETHLLEALALDEHPLVVPVGEQLAAVEQALELPRLAVEAA